MLIVAALFSGTMITLSTPPTTRFQDAEQTRGQ